MNTATHVLKMYSGATYNLTKEAAEFIQDIINNLKPSDQPFIEVQGSTLNIKGIDGIYERDDLLPTGGWDKDISEQDPLQITGPKNRFTREENIERMRSAAIEAKASERARFGLTENTGELYDWLPERLRGSQGKDGHECQSNDWKFIGTQSGISTYVCNVCTATKEITTRL